MSGRFFFNDTPTTEIYTLSLHDALPISATSACSGLTGTSSNPCPARSQASARPSRKPVATGSRKADRKSTRLNSSHANISYAVFCLKKKMFNSEEFTAIALVGAWYHLVV